MFRSVTEKKPGWKSNFWPCIPSVLHGVETVLVKVFPYPEVSVNETVDLIELRSQGVCHLDLVA